MKRFLWIVFSAKAASGCGAMEQLPPCEYTPAKILCVTGANNTEATLGEQEVYVQTFAEGLADEGFIPDVKYFMERVKGTQVIWLAQESFMCGEVEAIGCYDGSVVRVAKANCLGEAALAHELVHVYLHKINVKDGDGEHVDRIWNTRAQEALLRGFCDGKYRQTLFVDPAGL